MSPAWFDKLTTSLVWFDKLSTSLASDIWHLASDVWHGSTHSTSSARRKLTTSLASYLWHLKSDVWHLAWFDTFDKLSAALAHHKSGILPLASSDLTSGIF